MHALALVALGMKKPLARRLVKACLSQESSQPSSTIPEHKQQMELSAPTTRNGERQQQEHHVAEEGKAVMLTRQSFEVWMRWGLLLDDDMVMHPSATGSTAADSEELRGCLGMVLAAVDSIKVNVPQEAATAMEDREMVVLHFNIAPVVDGEECELPDEADTSTLVTLTRHTSDVAWGMDLDEHTLKLLDCNPGSVAACHAALAMPVFI